MLLKVMKRNTYKRKYSKLKVNNKMNNKCNKNRNKVQILSNHCIIQKVKQRKCKRNKQKIYGTCIAKEYYSSNNKMRASITLVSIILKLIK